MRNYFQLCNSLIGEVYFRIMKNHQYDLEYIIKNKFNPNIKFLIMKYSQEIRKEQKEYEEIQEQMKEVKNNGIK